MLFGIGIYYLIPPSEIPLEYGERFNKDISEKIKIDKNTIAFVSNRRGTGWNIWLMTQDGKVQVPLTNYGFDLNPTWSQDKKWIAYVTGEGTLDSPYQIFKVNIDKGKNIELTSRKIWADTPEWSPSGKYIAYTRQVDSNDPSHIWIMDSNGKENREITKGENWHYFPTWSPDEKYIAFTVERKNHWPQIGVVGINREGYRIITSK